MLTQRRLDRFSALQRAEIAEMADRQSRCVLVLLVSVLFNEPKLLKFPSCTSTYPTPQVSVLFNEPKLLKSDRAGASVFENRVSVLFNEPKLLKLLVEAFPGRVETGFSALQRAEIAEIPPAVDANPISKNVSVLFNEPKLLKCYAVSVVSVISPKFQCSSTSRNC